MGTSFWSDRRLVVRVVGPGRERVIATNTPYARVGSHERAEVVLSDAAIPRVGLYLHATERGIFWVDSTASSTDPQPHSGWLHAGDVVRLGDYRISASFAEGEEPDADPGPPLDQKGSAGLPVPVLFVLVKDQRYATYHAYRSLTVVGRRDPSTFRIRSAARFRHPLRRTGTTSNCGSSTC